MSYCINPQCQNPQNPEHSLSCHSCGSPLLLKNRYRALKPLGQNLLNRTFLAVDQDKPSQPRCVIQQFFTIDNSVDQPSGQEHLSRAFHHCATQLDNLGKHPRLPELLASFAESGNCYLVYEYIAGQSLGELLAQGEEFTEKEIWQLLKEVVPVLQLLHEQKLIHRDIKPDNIMQQPAPLADRRRHPHRFILVDFGSVMPLNGIPLHSGTPGAAEFVAPEQTLGKPILSSDLYSLGVTCLYLLTQVSPFDLYDIKADQWVWRDYLKQPVSPHLGQILDQMVQRDSRHRYHSTAALLRDIKSPPPPMTTFWQQPKWALAVWSSAAVALVSIFLSWRVPVPQPSVSNQRNIITPSISQPWEEDFFTSDAPMRTLAQTYSPVWSVVVSPRGRVLASGSSDGMIRLLNVHTGQTLGTLSGHQGPVWSLAISPDGRTLVSGSGDNTIKVWHFCQGQLQSTLPGHEGGVYEVAFSRDGERIASVGKDNRLKIWELATGKLLITIRNLQDVQSVVFSDHGKFVITGNNQGLMQVWNQKGKLIHQVAGHQGPIWSIALSPDGQTLATASWDRTVKLWDLSASGQIGRKPRQTLVGHGDKVQSLAFNGAGNTLASGDFTGAIKVWELKTGDLLGTLKGHTSWVEVAFDPTTNQLVSGSFDDTIKVWRLSQ